MLRVGGLAACFLTITTLTAPREASLKTLLARMVLCGEGSIRESGILTRPYTSPAPKREGLGQPRAQGRGGAH